MTDTIRYENNILTYVPPIKTITIQEDAIAIFGRSGGEFAFLEAKDAYFQKIHSSKKYKIILFTHAQNFLQLISLFAQNSQKLAHTLSLSVDR